jgi:hypothetical protein
LLRDGYLVLDFLGLRTHKKVPFQGTCAKTPFLYDLFITDPGRACQIPAESWQLPILPDCALRGRAHFSTASAHRIVIGESLQKITN